MEKVRCPYCKRKFDGGLTTLPEHQNYTKTTRCPGSDTDGRVSSPAGVQNGLAAAFLAGMISPRYLGYLSRAHKEKNW